MFQNLKKPYLVAEISANHSGNLKKALKIIKEAKENGANAVKIQTFLPDEMTFDSNHKRFIINDGLWKGYNLWKLYSNAQTPFKWHKELFKYAKHLDITLFSTPFGIRSLELLENLNCPIYKIASFEMLHLSLVKEIAQTRKPMIISTGMSNLKEIEISYNTALKYGAKDIALLYCVSNYPAKIEDFNLQNIKILKKKFGCVVGFSDHSTDNIVAAGAVTAGAMIFEKHIALSGKSKSLDSDFSLRGKELREYKENLEKSYILFKRNNFFRTKDELKNFIFRRSIFAQKDIKKGEKFTKINLTIVRPGDGCSPIYFEKLIGKKSPYNIKKFKPINNDILKKLKIKKII